VRPIGGDAAPVRAGEDRPVPVSARADLPVVKQLVVARAEQDQVGELGPAAMLDRDQVVRLELTRGGTARVLTVC
jgi:hypothetical protein